MTDQELADAVKAKTTELNDAMAAAAAAGLEVEINENTLTAIDVEHPLLSVEISKSEIL